MNRLISIFACLCIMSSIVGGRELHLKTTSFEDYIPLLENAVSIWKALIFRILPTVLITFNCKFANMRQGKPISRPT